MSSKHHHAASQETGLLVAVAAALALGWLAWNALLVESDVASVQNGPAAAPQPR